MSILKSLSNIPGWRTKRKIVVIESDDWGSLRAPSGDGLKKMQDLGLPLGNKEGIRFNKYDDLASSDDLASLFEVLESVKDSKGHSAVLTPLCLVANPDFQKIEKNHFKKYYYHTFLESLELQNKSNAWKLWKEGYQNKLFIPEFHGREHLNVHSWMNDLNLVNATSKKGFKDKIWGQSIISGIKTNQSHRSTYNISSYSELADLKKNIQEGIELINKTFNQQTSYFLPPDGPYHLKLNQALVDNGIKYIGLGKLHNNPLESKWHQKKMFWLGRQTKEGLKVITRNVIFEPASPKSSDWVGTALINIEKAFKYKHPAVISTHRANYTGTLNPNNRKNSLKQLESLLKQISEKWPNVEFMTSSQLGDTFEKS